MLLQRDDEIKQLQSDFENSFSSLCFIFAAEKIGKTTLIQSYIHSKKSLYFCFNEMLQSIQFKHLTHNQALNFESFLQLLGTLCFKEKTIIVFEDFHHLMKLDKNSFSILLQAWNKQLSKLNIQLLITSSNCSFYQQTLPYGFIKSIFLQAFDFRVIKKIIPTKDTYLQLQIYATFGTHIPYLKQYNLENGFYDNIKAIFLNAQLEQFHAPIHLLKSFTNDIATYSSILYAIACGHTKIGEIAQFLNVKASYLTRYLQTLMHHMIIEKKTPIFEDESSSKNGRYEFCSFHLRFWFAYIYANLSYIHHQKKDEIIQLVEQNFNSTLLVKSYKAYILTLLKHNSKAFLDFQATQVGSWWNHQGNSVDVVAYNKEHIGFFNCKLQSSPQANNFKDELIQNASNIKFNLNHTMKKEYGLFLL
jgi:AAA+ ATPase superfamily predicted ATPase